MDALMRGKTALACLAVWILVLVSRAHAGEMRQFQPIRTPTGMTEALPAGFKPVERMELPARETLAKAMEDLAKEWNKPELMNRLAEEFYDKSRLHDSMATPTKVPPEATLRILSVQNVNALQQMVREDPSKGQVRISMVQVRAVTRIEFNDPVKGFIRLDGTNDYVLQVKEEIR